MNGRIIACGDIHGAHKALVQCLKRSKFDPLKDTLIQLGDVADAWSETYECVEELLNIPNRICLVGNHDDAFHHWMVYGTHPFIWKQGSFATAQSYANHAKLEKLVRSEMNGEYQLLLTTADIPQEHRDFFNTQALYYIDTDTNICYVHGGFMRHEPFKGQPKHIYYWDRDLWMSALSFKGIPNPLSEGGYKFKMKTPFEEVYIGHTATVNWNTDKPMQAANIWNLDTGAGFSGRLTFMDTRTNEYWQSDLVKDLYPGERGRK